MRGKESDRGRRAKDDSLERSDMIRERQNDVEVISLRDGFEVAIYLASYKSLLDLPFSSCKSST